MVQNGKDKLSRLNQEKAVDELIAANNQQFERIRSMDNKANFLLVYLSSLLIALFTFFGFASYGSNETKAIAIFHFSLFGGICICVSIILLLMSFFPRTYPGIDVVAFEDENAYEGDEFLFTRISTYCECVKQADKVINKKAHLIKISFAFSIVSTLFIISNLLIYLI